MLELGAPEKAVGESSIVERMEEERGSALEIVERQAHWQCEQFLFTKDLLPPTSKREEDGGGSKDGKKEGNTP